MNLDSTMTGVFIGIGSVLGAGLIWLLLRNIIFSKVEIENRKEELKINQKDERNNYILEKSIKKISSIMTYILITLIIVLIAMKVEKAIILIPSVLLLIKGILLIIFSNYYSKKM